MAFFFFFLFFTFKKRKIVLESKMSYFLSTVFFVFFFFSLQFNFVGAFRKNYIFRFIYYYGLVAWSDKWACWCSHIGAKEVKSHKEISLFYDLNSIYSGINLKLWNIKDNNISWQKSQVSQLLVYATASYYTVSFLYLSISIFWSLFICFLINLVRSLFFVSFLQ
jgi:hypothetical protein